LKAFLLRSAKSRLYRDASKIYIRFSTFNTSLQLGDPGKLGSLTIATCAPPINK